ncbi:hypothetical protein CR513_59773, partial [Mucuna pruriens]
MGETPYWLTYGIDSIISIKIGVPSQRRSSFDPSKNLSSLKVNLDLVKEVKKQAYIRQELVDNEQPIDITPRSGLEILTKTISYSGGPEMQGRRKKIGN